MSEFKNDVFVSFSFKDFEIVKKIVKILEEKYGFKVWMCSEELHGGDQYFTIIPGEIRQSRVFLFIYSKNSLESKEIPSEIKIARNANATIIPFLIDDTELEDTDIEYFLVTLNYIDGTVPTLDRRIDELSQSIFSYLSKNGNTAHIKVHLRERLLSSKAVLPTKTYVGRKNVSQEIDDKFNEGNHVIFLHGIGGIGKTQVAKKYAFDHREQYDTIIFATYEGDLKSLIINETPFATEPATIRKIKENEQLETDEEFYKRKLAKIKELSNDRVLIIVDNFDEEYKEEFLDLFDGPYRLLITTRVSYSRTIYPQIEINPLEDKQELIELFFNNYDGDVVSKDDPHLMDLFKLVNYHTYTIELLANHMEMSLQTVDEMIESLKREGILSINEEVINSEMKTSVAYQNLLKLYKISDLKENEIDALRFMLFVPIEGIPSIYIKMWGGDDIFRTVRELEKRSWVIKGTSNGYTLHPIVYQIVKNNVEVNHSNCKSFLERFDSYLAHENSWSFKKVEKELYASFSYKILELFPEITKDNFELYYDIQCLLSFATNARLAVTLAERLYEFHKKEDGEVNFYTARSAYKVGWAYIFNTELPNLLENAKKWILYSFELFQQINRELNYFEKIEFYNMMRHVAKVYQFSYMSTHNEEDYEKALYYAKWTLDKCNQESDEELKNNRLGSMNIQVADVYLVHKEYESALFYEGEAERTSGEYNTDILYHRTRKAKCLVGLHRYEEALTIALECIDGFIEKDGKYSSTTLDTYQICLECYKALGNKEKEQACEIEIANIRKALFA